uniref:NADH-ubiquinone oxidoreductase chain 5 n=1 Tax=Tubulipora flabellaris TaxID=365325 RepID=F6GPJ0_9BILA|nr:NADH dehydrogenase subunit 5 [Tubulipora flabellaris]ACB12461.1 NADH dehydrogenase subunit 5 [Tubulipora flabellaris]
MNVSLSVILDFYTCIFSLSVIIITSSVVFYSWGYMSSELNMSRFYKLILGFVMSMLILISSSNLFFIMVGWDGLGILSFLLVIFYQNESSLGSGLITFMSNRVGDAFLLILISMMGISMNWSLMNNFSFMMLMILMLGAITKSAQIPFSSWLPRAMAAPTPISALVHSSTLVTAGVFLLIRFSDKLNYSMFLVLGTLTSLLAGLSGMVEHDVKKIIALSTLSQLGIMFMSLGLNMPDVAFFHLCTHAYFKAMIFITAGSMIDSNLGNQDIRLYGLNFKNSPIISMFLFSGNMALMGLPFMAGFYSKDAMLEMFMTSNLNMMLVILCWLGIMMTSVYSTRMMILSSWMMNFNPSFYFNSSSLTFYPLFVLNLGAISAGSFLSYYLYFDPFFSGSLLKLLPFIMFFLGVSISLMFWMKELKFMIFSSIGFLNPISELFTSTQKSIKNYILISEYG